MTRKAEAVVIGGGPAGYVAAIRLGQLGKETLLIEKESLGGVCLNIGCIPSKALIRVGKLKQRIEAAKQIGIETTGVTVDFGKVQAWKQSVVDRLVQGVEYLLKGNNVQVMKGTAKFTGPHQLEVTTATGTEVVEAKDIVVATGSRYFDLPVQIQRNYNNQLHRGTVTERSAEAAGDHRGWGDGAGDGDHVRSAGL